MGDYWIFIPLAILGVWLYMILNAFERIKHIEEMLEEMNAKKKKP